MAGASFQIVVPSYSTSVDEWRRAMTAPSSDLPPLSDAQREVARKFKVTDEEYARNVLAGSYGQERMRSRARALGETVQGILEQLHAGRVIAVIRDMDRVGWVIRVETPRRDVDVQVSQELADDLMDSDSADLLERLKLRVASSIGVDEAAISR